MNYVILNGVDSRSINGLIIQELPPIIKPAMRAEIEEIDGKDGDIVTDLGYAAYTKTMSIGLYGQFDIDAVIAFFNSRGTVIFSNESDKIYNYQVIEQIDFERLIRFRTASVNFHVQPFKFSVAEKPVTFTPVATNGQGTSVTLQPTTEGETLDAISFYGVSNQSGTPTPTAPQTINNVTGTIPVTFSGGGLSNATSLSLSRLELCKIGSYQDYIFKAGDEWAKYTAIKSYTVDTSAVTLQNYSNVTYAVIPTPTNALCYGNYKDIPCLCTHAAYSYGLNEGWNTANAVNKIFCQADANTFWLGMPAGTTLAQAQAALNGCMIYYVLLNRANVPLASQGLQSQLDALLEIGLYNGSTTITTGASVKPIINVTATMETFTIKNTGNIYARPLITVYGTGNISISVNNQQIFNIALGDTGYITIDGAALEAYQDGIPRNRLVTGDYDNFILNVGNNVIEIGGQATQITVENYSRWI